MESFVDDELSEKALKYYWNQFITTAHHAEKSRYLDAFLEEFLKMYSLVRGNVSKMPVFGDLHSVSNMLAREFQTIILAKCTSEEDDQEQSLVGYLCHGSGLMLLEVLCILAYKIAGCSSELANLIVTLLAVILQVPSHEYDSLQVFEMIKLDYDNYFQDPKCKPHHSTVVQEMILKHCEHLVMNSKQTFNIEPENVLDKNQESTLTVPSQDHTDSSSATEESDILTSISSIGSIGLHSSNEETALELHRQSSGISSLLESTDILTHIDQGTLFKHETLSNQETPTEPDIVVSNDTSTKCEDVSINSFDLLLLMLTVLENLCCRESSSYDTSLTVKTSGQLIDLIACLNGENKQEQDLEVLWDLVSTISARLFLLRTVYFFMYATFRNPKSAKQLVKSSYVKKLVEFVENEIQSAALTAEQAVDLINEMPPAKDSSLWQTFHHVFFVSLAFRGLVVFISSCVQFGSLINSSLLALSRELLEQFNNSGGFNHLATIALKYEELQVALHSERLPDNDISIVAMVIKTLPKDTTLHVLSLAGKVISLLKRGKLHCRSETNSTTHRKSIDSYIQFQPPSDLMTSDVDESSESAGDMENENEKRSQNIVDQCQILHTVITTLNIFKNSQTQYLSLSILSCLAKVGICGCIQPDDLVTPLLTRFLLQPRPLQTQILQLINQLVIASLDNTILSKGTQEQYTTRPRSKSKRLYSKSPKGGSVSKRSSVLSDNEILSFSPHLPKRHQKDDHWSCLSQYCTFLTTGDQWLALETAKSMKTLVLLGSSSLKNELFRVVLLPSLFRFDLHRNSSKSEDSTSTPTNTSSQSSLPGFYRDRSQTLRPSSAIVNQEVLKVLLGYLPSLLVSHSSRSLFFDCGGLSELQVFLDVVELQELVVGVFEFLASLEDCASDSPLKDTQENHDGQMNQEGTSAVRTFLTLLRYTANVDLFTKSSNSDAPELSDQEKCPEMVQVDESVESSQQEHTLNNLSLCLHVWKACLNLLVSNKVFVESFIADRGPVYSIDLFKWMINYFSCSVSKNEEVLSETVALFEVILAVCIRVSYAGLTQDFKGVPGIQSILRDAEQVVIHSDILKDMFGRGLCDSFTKAAVKRLYLTSYPNQQDNSDVLEKELISMNPEGELAQLIFDDDLDTPAHPKKSVEDGYEADNEVNTDSSDDSDAKTIRQTTVPKKTSREARQNSEKSTIDFHGLVGYPQVCHFLFTLLEAAYGGEPCKTTSKSLSVLTHATQSLVSLAKDCEHNCRVLCEEGLLGAVLHCYRNILCRDENHLRGLQAIVVNLLVILASQQIKAAELKDFISLFKSKSIPVDLLCSGLAQIASKASISQGPAFTFTFPCRLHTVDSRLKNTGKKTKSQRLRQEMMMKRNKGGSLHSPGDASSEGCSTEGSWSKVRHSPECSERHRRGKPQSKLIRGMKARNDSDTKDRGDSLQAEDSADLPSPFSIKAVNLRCHGNQPWPVSDLSIAFWVRVHNPKKFPDVEISRDRVGLVSSRPNSEWTGTRSDSISCDDAVHVCSFGSRKCLFEVWLFPSNASFLFRWTKSTRGSTDGYDVTKELVTRHTSFTRGRWHHVVISLYQSKQKSNEAVIDRSDSCKILLIVDGTDVTEQSFGPPLPNNDEKCTLSVVLIGQVTLTSKRERSGEEKEVLPDGYDVGCVMLFTAPVSKGSKKRNAVEWLVGKNEAFYLYSLGPNAASVGHLQNDFELMTSNNPSQSFLIASKLWSRLSISERSVGSELKTGYLTSPFMIIPDIESSIRGNLFLSYSPKNPSMFSQAVRLPYIDDKSRRTSQYDTSKPPITVNFVQNEAKLFHEVKALRVSTLLEAAYDVGGMTVFIYLFGKVVEMTNDHKTQADALSVVLSLQRNCEYHACAMYHQSGYALLKRILLTPQCMVGYHMLKILMEAACDGDVFKQTNLSDNPIMLNIDSNAVVRNVDIFQHYLLNWKIWDKAKQGVFEMLLSTLEILVHASHPHYKFNICQFQKAELVQQLLIGCQERLGEGLTEIPSSISTLYVNIIHNIMGNPPDLTVLKAVCEFLIAVHPTEEIIRLHSPSRFYLTERSFRFDCRIPAVTRQPLLVPSSLSAPTIKRQSPIPMSNPVQETSTAPHSSPIQTSNSVPPSSAIPASSSVTSPCNPARNCNDELREVCDALSVVQDDKHPTVAESDRKISSSSAHSTLSSSQEPESSTVQFIGPHFASCPQPSAGRNLTVQIPSQTPPTAKPVYGSADGASILLQNSPLNERYSSFSSPSANQTPLNERYSSFSSPSANQTPPTPQAPAGESYTGPESNPMSISNQSSTPQSMATSSVDVMEYDFIDESDFSSFKGSFANQSSVDEYLVVEGYPGIKSSTGTYKPGNKRDRRKHVTDHMTKMRLGLLKLLQKVLLNLQAEQIPGVVGGVLKVEYLLVWVSHHSSSVRELVIKILCLYLQKAESERYNHFVDIRGFHLLANQIYDHEVTKGTIEALLWLLVGRPVDLEKDYAYSTASMDQCLLSSVRALGVVPLLSILEDTLVSQHLHHMLVKHICQLFLKVDELSLKAVSHGLLHTICNVITRLARIHHQQSMNKEDTTVDVNALMDDIQSLIASVVIRACSTCGSVYFQMFEELLVVLGNLEERDHQPREYDLSIFFIARYLRYFAIQVALHYHYEISKEEYPGGGWRKKSTGMRFPFRGGEKCTDHHPFKPVSTWIPLSHDHNMPCWDLGLLKNTPTSANSNEQTQRFQLVLQIAVNCVTYSRTFLSNDLSPLQFYAADLQIHDCLKPGMIQRTTSGINIEKDFAQFVFSLLFETMDLLIDGKGTLPSKFLFVVKDVIKSHLAKLLVFLISPSQPLDLSCFAVQIANHPQAKRLLQYLLSGNGGGKIRDKLLVYLPIMLSDNNLTASQTNTTMNFKSLLESCGLKFSTVEEVTSKSEMEVQVWDQTDTTNIVEWHKKRLEAFKVISQRIEVLSGQLSRSAMDVTRVAVEIQDSQRQTLLKHNRDALSAEVQVRKKWRQLIERLIHERSIWYDRDFFPKSWRLDPTEGPLRVRCRMQRFHLDVPAKHVMQGYRKNGTVKCISPLAYLFEDCTSSHRKNVYYIFDTPDTIRFLYHCRHILLDVKTNGVILIGESHMYFIGEEATTADTDVTQILLGNKDAISISWLIKEIQEIRTRRYCLQEIGVEVFLTNGRTYFLAFDTESDRDIILDQFKQRMLPIYETPAKENIHNTTMLWRTGNLSNFEYLTELNKVAGRTFNDLMQYPVFPFILADFSSEVLDLNDTSVFRDLSKPIAAQNYKKEMNYRERFRWLKEEFDRSGQGDPMSAPYHYGSHYSNSGTVLHFLVRLPPFTKMFLQYQDRSFDIPDRTFHSMATTWRLSSYESSTDVKELIPEFFFLPEFLENIEGFDFGLRQCGDRVMDVTLPPWAKGNARLFILVHRQALETEHVTRYLHKWIDLVFGYKQTGPEAIEAINVFHPATYYGVEVNSITDPIRQKALKTMIETYGQTPRQLFPLPHSPRVTHKNLATSSESSSTTSLGATSKNDGDTISSTATFKNRFHQSFSSENSSTGTVETFVDVPRPVSTVEGLRWGQYVCSPSLPVPSITLNHTINVPGTLLVCDKLDRVNVLCRQSTLVSVHDDRNDRFLLTGVISWAGLDGSLMVFPEGSGPGMWLMDVKTPDKVTSCAVNNDCTSLFIGSSSGVLSYLPIKYNPSLDRKIELQGSCVHLYGHNQVVTCLHICHEYSVLVSGSRDGTAIIWDICRLSYIRTLQHTTAVQTLAVSRRSGDVATVSHQDEGIDEDDSYHDNQGSMLYLWTVNGRPVSSAKCDHMISCVDFSRAPEGVSVNVIATGLSNGAIRLWSTWDLQHIRDIAPEQNLHPIISVAFSEDSQRLFALNNQSRLIMWQRKDKIIARPPSIITFPSSYVGPRATQDGRTKTEN